MYSTFLLKRFLQIVILLLISTTLFGETYIVDNTSDSGTGSLRQAIIDANNNPGGDMIEFNIPQSDDNYRSNVGVWTIKPETQLPTITDEGLVIDGGTQAQYIGSDTNPVGPEIELDGSLTTNTDGFYVTANGAEIFELIINRFHSGIAMQNVDGGMISGCYIGTDPTGMSKLSNNVGIGIYSNSHHITVSRRDEKPSIISGNPNVGITINDSSTQNVICGNIIGLNRTCQDTLGNGWVNRYGGISIADRSDSNQVIDNDIGGNTNSGVSIYNSNHNFIGNNRIGTDGDWSLSLGNTDCGVWIKSEYTNPESTCYNVVTENLIGNNGSHGVSIHDQFTLNNTITRNSISRNDSYGILLDGGNNDLATPTIASVTESEITGTAGSLQKVEFFCDEEDEGRIFLGDTVCCEFGMFTFDLSSPPPLPKITATATDSDGNTSMFSLPVSTTGIETEEGINVPETYRLEQNFPNPFNPTTTIIYALPKQSHILLQIFDIKGGLVRTLMNSEKDAGTHSIQWNAMNDFGIPVSSGLYICRLNTDNGVCNQKLILTR